MKSRCFALSITLSLVLFTLAPVWSQAPQPQVAPPVVREIPPLPPRTGFIPPAVDLSHLQYTTGRGKPIAQPPASFDWRNPGAPYTGSMISPVKDQGVCGACYSFASLGSFESKILIDGSALFNLSENHAKECYFTDPNCGGGNNYQMACIFSQNGTQLESCNPYIASNTVCNTVCPYQQTLLDWCIISPGAVPTNMVLKNYIQNNGPVYTTLYVGSGPGDPWYDEFAAYDGSYGLSTTYGGTVNHAVLIVGWDDNQSYDTGHDSTIDGTGCWIVKNSWGTGWGGTCGFGAESGYFYMRYANADIGQWSSFLDGWQSYDTNGGLLYFDEAGWGNIAWGFSSTTCWALCRYAVTSDVKATAIEFWTNDQTTDVDVYLHNGFTTSTGTLGTLLTSSLNHSFSEAGYHSVSITPTDIGPSSNPEAVAVIKVTNSSYASPIPADWGNGSPPLETNRCYISPSGATGVWAETSNHVTYPSDLGVRIRTTTPPSPVERWEQY